MRTVRDKGLSGISAIVVFVAVILVAAVAALVLTAVSYNMEEKSVGTGSQTRKGIVTGIEVISVFATDGSSGNDLEKFELFLRLSHGSEAMNLNKTIIILDSETGSQTVSFNSTAGYGGVDAATTSDFTVEYLTEGPVHSDGYLSKGDVINLRFNYLDYTGSGDGGGVGENKKIKIKVFNGKGRVNLIEFTTPDVIKHKRVTLWP
ncbi:MAG: hypothetical protein GF334_12745, partial [Candidatus Altiarchaeales archaeon]|nr:hypothetical protein [Candidatus Altiarchaeales archaeon]